MNKIIILLIILCACSQPQEKAEMKNYRIAYNVWVDKAGDDYEVFTMNLDGSDQKNVTNLPGVEWTYKSAGKDLLYISDQDTCKRCYFLYSTDAMGKEHQKIGGYQLKDSWHGTRKNGQEIIVTPKERGDSSFYILNRKGEIVQKVNPGLSYFSDPDFSPDGEQVVFRGSEKRFKANIGYQDELYIVNLDGSGLRKLTTYPKGDTTANWYSYHAGPPFWEPNHNVITYHSKQQGGSFLFQINPDGTGLKKLTPDSLQVNWHSWSSDGRWITFDALVGEGDNRNYDIFLMKYSDGTITRVTNSELFEQAPNFVEVE